MKLATRILLAGALILSNAAMAAKPVSQPDIRDLMSARQFQQAGLDKLTSQELAALNAWLDEYLQAHPAAGAAPAAPPAAAGTQSAVPAAPAAAPATASLPPLSGEAAFGIETTKRKTVDVPDHIVSHISGTFNGFYSGAVFKLDNGQVWKETDNKVFKVRLENPKVIIKKAWVGYLMRIDGYGTQAFVVRVK